LNEKQDAFIILLVLLEIKAENIYVESVHHKKFEDTKGGIRSGKLKDRQCNAKRKWTKEQTMIYKILHRTL
jgi:hypothetical protein